LGFNSMMLASMPVCTVASVILSPGQVVSSPASLVRYDD